MIRQGDRAQANYRRSETLPRIALPKVDQVIFCGLIAREVFLSFDFSYCFKDMLSLNIQGDLDSHSTTIE